VRGQGGANNQGPRKRVGQNPGSVTISSRRTSAMSVCPGPGPYIRPRSRATFYTTQTAIAKTTHRCWRPVEAEGPAASSVLIKLQPQARSRCAFARPFDHVSPCCQWGRKKSEWRPPAKWYLRCGLIRSAQQLALRHSHRSGRHLEDTPADTPCRDSEISEVDGKIKCDRSSKRTCTTPPRR